MFDMWARESWGAFAKAIYVRDYSIWFICVGTAKREEFHRPFLGVCSSRDSRVNVQPEDQSHTDTAASQGLHLQCVNTDWHVATHATAAFLELHMLTFIAFHEICRDRISAGFVDAAYRNNLSTHLLPHFILPHFQHPVRATPSVHFSFAHQVGDVHLSQSCPSL